MDPRRWWPASGRRGPPPGSKRGRMGWTASDGAMPHRARSTSCRSHLALSCGMCTEKSPGPAYNQASCLLSWREMELSNQMKPLYGGLGFSTRNRGSKNHMIPSAFVLQVVSSDHLCCMSLYLSFEARWWSCETDHRRARNRHDAEGQEVYELKFWGGNVFTPA